MWIFQVEPMYTDNEVIDVAIGLSTESIDFYIKPLVDRYNAKLTVIIKRFNFGHISGLKTLR